MQSSQSGTDNRPVWKRPPWRTVIPGVTFLAVFFLGYALWQPGRDFRDGRHDRGTNALWLQHGWLGADSWFTENGKTERIPEFRSEAKIAALAARLRDYHVTDVFPHLCPAAPDGEIAPYDDRQVERFLDSVGDEIRVLPWVGGRFEEQIHPEDAGWRKAFTRSIAELLEKHPRLAGVHLNIEPWPSGNTDLPVLLEEIRAALPPGKLLSLSCYPPPTIFHAFPEVHWEEAYFRLLAGKVDQMAVMLYDTALPRPKLYQSLLSRWAFDCLRWAGDTPVLLGVPVYEDEGVLYHNPEVENIENSLSGLHAALARFPSLPKQYQGVALYSEWVMDDREWAVLRERFLKPGGR